MAMFDVGSFLKPGTQQQPQQNQFLTGNPSTDTNAQTSWMNPDTSNWAQQSGDISGSIKPAQTNTPPSNGTALGAITAGNTGQSWSSTPGQTPLGFDQGKWNDPGKHDPKYDAGHMLASGKSLEEIGSYIQSNYPGYKYLGGDRIQGDDGNTYDFSYGSKAGINAPMWEQVGGSGQQQGGFTGQMGNNQNWQQFMNNLMQQLFQGKQANRFNNQGQNNPSSGFNYNSMPVQSPPQSFQMPYSQGGFTPPTGGINPNGMTDQGQYGGLTVQPNVPPINSFAYWPGMQMQPGVNY